MPQVFWIHSEVRNQLLRLCSSRDRHKGSANCQALYFIHKFRETEKMTTQGVSGYDRLIVR